MLLKIGELAKRSGLTIRTLHHYDAIGLLRPSARSDAGYRLYDRSDVARLHRIQALRGLDLSLGEIGLLLTGEGADLRMVIRQQIISLERQLAQAADLRDRLTALNMQLASEDEPDLDEWLSTLGLMAMHRKYFTQEEIDALQRRKEQNNLNVQWPGLVAEVRALMDRGIPAHSKEAQALTERWLTLSAQTMGDDPRFFAKLTAMHRTEFSVQALTGVDGPLLDFISMAAFEIRCGLYAKYVTPEELDHFRRNYPKKSMHSWPSLFAETRQLMEQHVAPEQPDAQALFRRWAALFQETWGKDPAIRDKVRTAHRDDPRILAGSGINPAMQAYIDRGMAFLASGTKSS